MISDFKTNFDFFNQVVNEQITKVRESTIDEDTLQKIKTKFSADDVFNNKLRDNTIKLLENTILKDEDVSKPRSKSLYTPKMETIMKSNPLGKHFQDFVVELFEIAQSSEMLKYTLKFIIDTILKVDKYKTHTFNIFLCYLVTSNNEALYPEDYAEHADFISKFCSDYILLKKYTNFVEEEHLEDVYVYMTTNEHKQSILTHGTLDTYENLAFSNAYAVTNNGWILLTHYTEVLVQDGSVLSNNTFSDFHKKVIFKNIEKCLKEYKISDLDYLDYLIRVLATMLKKNTTKKLIDKKLRNLVVYLSESGFGARNKDNIIYSLARQFVAGVSKFSTQKTRDGYIDSRDSRSMAPRRDEIDEQNQLNMGFAWVSLIFIHEGIFALKSLLDVFSNYNKTNEVLLERLSFYFRKNNVDYTEMLKQEDAASSENALSAASLLTASRDEEFTRKEGEKASLEVTEIPKKEKESRFQISVEEKSNDTLAKIPIKTFPQVLLLTAFLEVQCFKEASYIISCFKLLLSGNSELEELFSSVLNSYGKELIGEENISNEDKIANNSYYWLFTTPGTLNIESSRLSLDDFVKVGTILISNGNDPKSIKSTFDSFTTMLYHYKKLDDERTLESLLNPLINCVINELIPRCMLGSKTISKHLYSLLKHLNSEIRYEVYDIFTKKVISENSTLKEINVLQQKQIKRFLKVVNVDNLSSQLEKLAVLVNINPFITLTNCLNLAESYDMISNLLIQSMKHFTDFSLDVLQYTILKRLKIDRPFFTEDEGLALPWFAKICSLLTNGFNSFSKFSVYDIFDFCLSKIIAGDFTGVYILDALITGSSDCLYLDDVQDELAILYSGNEETKKIALEKTDAIKKQKTHKLMRMLTKKKHGKSHALIILESLSGIIFEIFYDSFQTVNKINNNYDIVVRVQKLIIDILAHNRNQEVFAETFDIPSIITNPSLQYLSDAWKALLLRNSSRKIQKDLLPKLSDHKSLFEFFWYHSLADLNTLAISHMPENLRGSLDADMFSVPELKGFDNFKEKVFSNDQLQQFLEICLLKNSLLGVAEAIYSAEFVFRILSEVEITKLLGLIFNNKFISKAVIGISSNESKFFAAFIKRIFMILPTYYTTLEEDKLQIFKTSVVSFMKSFSVELSDLVLDDEYINCRNAIQILSESIKFLPPIDIFVKILVDAIEKRLLNESRKELLVPLNAVVGFSKTKLKECERVSEFSDVELDEILKELDEILQLSKEVIQENIKLEQLNDDLSAAEAEKQDTIERLSEKKVSIEQESIATKRFNDGEDLRKDTKRIKLNYEENADDDASKSTTAEVGSAAGSRFEGFGNTATTEKSASPVPKTLVLPTQPKSKVITNILEQLENPDFKRYIETKISNDIRPHAEFNMKRNLEFLEQALVADSAYLSYVVPTLKFFRLSRLVDALLEVLTEKPEYFMNGFLYSLLHVFTFNGRSENKQLVLDLWNKTEVASHLKITLEEMKTNWHKLNNLKTLVYDRQWVYTFVEQIDILVQYLMTKRENQFSDQTVYLAFIQKEYPESAFSRYTEESQGGYREGGRREGSRRDRSRREGDRERSRFSEDAPSDDLRRRGDRRGGDRSREDRHLDDRPREDRRGGDRSREDRRGGDRSREDRHLDDRPREDRRGGDRSREDRRGVDRPREDRRGEDRRGSDRPREDRRDGDRPREDRRSDDRPREDRRGEDRRGSDRPREDRRLDDRPREDRRGEDRFTDGRRRESRPHDDRPSDDLRNNSGYDRGYNSNNRRDESESRFNRRQSDRSYSYRDSRRY